MADHVPHPARLCAQYDDLFDGIVGCLPADVLSEAEKFRTDLADYAEAVAIGTAWINSGRPHSRDCRVARLTNERSRRGGAR